MKKLRFALPKGSLNKEGRWSTEALLKQAGFDIVGYEPSSRSYAPKIKDVPFKLESIVDRPQNMPQELNEGVIDLGILGTDIAEEWRLAGVNLVKICDLGYGYADLVVAVPIESSRLDLNSYLSSMSDKRILRCATEYPFVAQEKISKIPAYQSKFGSKKPMIKSKYGTFGENQRLVIIESYGATESAVNPKKSADFLVECTSTGTTLKENGLKPIETLIESSAGLYSTEEVMKDAWKADNILFISDLLQGAVKARKTYFMVFNVQRDGSEGDMVRYLKENKLCAKEPTVNEGTSYSQFQIQVPKDRVLRVLRDLRSFGAEDINILQPSLTITSYNHS